MTNFEYINQYTQIHDEQEDYGASSKRYFPEICILIDYLKPKTILDYGCGKGTLDKLLIEKYPNIKIYQYDPAIEKHSQLPVKKADMIICQDVLEHIPETLLPDVLTEISSISQNVYFNISHIPANDFLPNGENAHCTVKPKDWFRKLLLKYFKNVTLLRSRFFTNSVQLTFDIDNNTKLEYLKIVTEASKEQYAFFLDNVRKNKSE